jgi:phytanoyl-CoA hydroxylase
VGDDYFLNSGDKIRFFLEQDAVGEGGKLTRPKHLAVNKIGHGKLVLIYHTWISLSYISALHQLDPTFRRVTLENERMRAVARDLKFHRDPVGMAVVYLHKLS